MSTLPVGINLSIFCSIQKVCRLDNIFSRKRQYTICTYKTFSCKHYLLNFQFALNSKLKVHFEPVLQQEGGIDCGVFSIANAYNAAMGKSAKDITYDSQQMRSHLQHCFEAKEWSTFPQTQNSAVIIRCNPKEVTIELYCTCGLPETYDSQMVLCAECQKWFHLKCMKIKDIPKGRWLCTTCKTDN